MTNFKHLESELAEVFILDDFLIAQIKEGQHVDKLFFKELKKLIKTYFDKKPFVYISNRVHSYSVDALLYKEIFKVSEIIGIGIIATNSLVNKNAQFEKQFFKKPFKTFTSLSEACIWVNELITKTNS